jgi:hypothetical protein
MAPVTRKRKAAKKMTEAVPELYGWRFDSEEVSVGVYRVRGISEDGRSVEETGIDPEAVLERCRRAAMEIMTHVLLKAAKKG